MERRQLDNAHEALGLLGWQQADYDEVTQAKVEEIENCEREQARVANEGARLGLALRELQATRDAELARFESSLQPLETELQSLEGPTKRMEAKIAELKRQEPGFEKRIPELDHQLEEVSRRYKELLSVTNPSPKILDDIQRLRDRVAAIPNEKAELRTSHLRTVSEIKSLEESLQSGRGRIDAIQQEIRAAQQSFRLSDQTRVSEIRALEKEREQNENESKRLEAAKRHPYRQIGAVLAQYDISPLNQPEALQKVRQIEEKIAAYEAELERSREITNGEDPEMLRVSWFVWIGVGTAFIVLLGLVEQLLR